MKIDETIKFIQNFISECQEEGASDPQVNEDAPLIGGNSVIDSMHLVELCLLLEDKAEELGQEFDWTSDSAMSRSRSIFRTIRTLADEFVKQTG